MFDASVSHVESTDDSHLSWCSRSRRKTKEQNLILKNLARYGLMTFEQLSEATHMSYRGVSKTVMRLRNIGQVGHCRWVDTQKAPNRGPVSPYHVCVLTRKGQKRLIDDRIILKDTPVLTRTWDGQVRQLNCFDHDRKVVDLMVQIDRAFADYHHLDVYDQRVATTKTKVVVGGRKMDQSSVYEPLSNGRFLVTDALVRLHNNQTSVRTDLFVEFSNKSNTKFVVRETAKKFRNYHELFTSKDRAFVADRSVLLYIVSRKTLINSIFEMEEIAPLLGVVRIAHYDDVLANPLGDVWVSGDNTTGRLKLLRWSPVNG